MKRLRVAEIDGSQGRLLGEGVDIACRLGRAGAVPAERKREGDGATPLGRWPIRQLLFRPDRLARPETGLPLSALEPAQLWCDDPAHAAYNRLVHAPFDGRHERLWRADHRYDLILVLGYNDDPPVPGKGSAIFLHCTEADGGPTAGCVAVAQAALLALLPALGPGSDIAIGVP